MTISIRKNSPKHLVAIFLTLIFFIESNASAGKSIFEEYFDEHGASYPFEGMLKDIAEKGIVHHFDGTLIPDGRSLQKDNATFLDPRAVVSGVTGNTQNRPDQVIAPPPIFMGHASTAGQIEVISWNPTDRRYEFLIIENYRKGEKATLHRPKREVCKTCHQGEGPIFSRQPWSETTGTNIQSSLRKKIIQTKLERAIKEIQSAWKELGGNPQVIEAECNKLREASKTTFDLSHIFKAKLHELLNEHELNADVFFEKVSERLGPNDGIVNESAFLSENSNSRIQGGTNRSFNIDRAVIQANSRMQSIQICHDLCGSDKACKRNLLAWTVMGRAAGVGTSNQTASIDALDLQLADSFHAIVKRLNPEKDFSYASPAFPDRNPLVNPEKGGTTQIHYLKKGVDPSTLHGLARRDDRPGFTNEYYTKSRIIDYDDSVALEAVRESDDIKVASEIGVQHFASPLTERPKIGHIRDPKAILRLESSLPACFGLSPQDLRDLMDLGRPQDRVQVALEDPIIDRILEHWPPDRETVMSAMKFALSGERRTALDELCDDLDEMTPYDRALFGQIKALKSASEVILKPGSEDDARRILSEKCAQCHVPGSSKFLSKYPLNLQDLKIMNAFRDRIGKSAGDRIKKSNMPPKSEPQLTDEEKATLLHYLKPTGS